LSSAVSRPLVEQCVTGGCSAGRHQGAAGRTPAVRRSRMTRGSRERCGRWQ